jgi:hypothetical protein
LIDTKLTQAIFENLAGFIKLSLKIWPDSDPSFYVNYASGDDYIHGQSRAACSSFYAWICYISMANQQQPVPLSMHTFVIYPWPINSIFLCMYFLYMSREVVTSYIRWPENY